MSTAIMISEQVANHLNDLAIGDDIDETLRLLLVAEYRRKLTHYRLTNKQLSKKYQMSFAAFEEQQITKAHHYSWDVESDAITWETAVDGIRTVQHRLAEVEHILVKNDLL
ncbi:MAG: hypothetical protein KDE56_25180 [Anaerolineales bacterium]|nr:hypothetical protein [Anaerolineales bacterium]